MSGSIRSTTIISGDNDRTAFSAASLVQPSKHGLRALGTGGSFQGSLWQVTGAREVVLVSSVDTPPGRRGTMIAA